VWKLKKKQRRSFKGNCTWRISTNHIGMGMKIAPVAESNSQSIRQDLADIKIFKASILESIGSKLLKLSTTFDC
jgi:hypothetical protein